MPFVCNPLTVAEGNKPRLVLDLRHVNWFLEKQKIKYEDLRTFTKIFEQGYHFATFDLKHGYHHVSINPDHYQYLGFAWDFQPGVTRYFVFVVLPFGLSTACYLFTKLLRPLIKKWRGEGLRSIIYIDDGIFGTLSKILTTKACLRVRADLENAGFTLNEIKSKLYPQQIGEWLGFGIDLENFILFVPQQKLAKVMNLLSLTRSKPTTSAREIARVAGLIISMGPAVGPLSRLFTRRMYKFVQESDSWDRRIPLTDDVSEEIKFWIDNFNFINGYAIKSKHACTKIVYSDASAHGYGGFVAQKLGNEIAHGQFSADEKSESSTYRELAAVKYVLQSLRNKLAHERILWHSDNINVARIINVGSSKNHLQNLTLDIHRLCLRYDIEIISQWIPREVNELADEISKFNDTDDWGIDNESFAFIQKEFGIFTIDRFASSTNNKVVRFDARFHCPHAESINTFTAHWGNDFNWLCPPISLIGDTLKHAQLCRAKAVLFVPEWKSAYFWPLLTKDGNRFYSFVKQYRLLDPVYVNNSRSQSAFNGFADFRSLALLIEF